MKPLARSRSLWLRSWKKEKGTDCPFQGLPPYMENNTSQWHAVLSLVHSQAEGIDDSGIVVV